jgi:oxygen-independent coproporphyrinogen-3 oxidase
MERGLYIHIPFCSQICSYCDFAKFYYNQNLADLYIDEIIKEIKEKKCDNISSIYIGGGTPSSLSYAQLDKLLSYLYKNFYRENISFAIEANAENLDIEKIEILKKYKINRVSLGVQTFSDDLIKLLNRNHNYKMIKNTISLLKENGINDINCDLIYGLPNQSKEMLMSDLKLMLGLDITHVSTYALSINKNTLLYINKVKEVDDDIYREYYDLINNTLKENGFNRYEVSNFSKPGYESKHNILYWKNKEYYGIGLGASGYLNNIRYDNTKSLNKYLSGEREIYQEVIGDKEKEFYFLMLGLRLKEGVDISEYHQLFNKDIFASYKNKIDNLLSRKLIEIENNHLKITDNNLFIMDYILKILLF